MYLFGWESHMLAFLQKSSAVDLSVSQAVCISPQWLTNSLHFSSSSSPTQNFFSNSTASFLTWIKGVKNPMSLAQLVYQKVYEVYQKLVKKPAKNKSFILANSSQKLSFFVVPHLETAMCWKLSSSHPCSLGTIPKPQQGLWPQPQWDQTKSQTWQTFCPYHVLFLNCLLCHCMALSLTLIIFSLLGHVTIQHDKGFFPCLRVTK